MAMAILGSNGAARKPLSTLIQRPMAASLDWTLPGLCQHPSVSPDAQVRILGVVKETGNAALSDLVAALPEFAEPAAAVLGLVETGVLAIDAGLIDGDSVLSLADHQSASDDADVAGAAPSVEQTPTTAAPTPGAAADYRDHDAPAAPTAQAPSGDTPPGVRRLQVNQYSPALFIAAGDDRGQFRKIPELKGPGFYLAIGDKDVYIGCSPKNVGERLASGTHLADPEQTRVIVAIVDQHGRLSPAAARAGERRLAQVTESLGEKPGRNKLPVGDAIEPLVYERVDLLVAEAAMAMRHAGLFFTKCPAKALTDITATMARERDAAIGEPVVERPAPLSPSATGRRGRSVAVPAWSEPGLYALGACGVQARARVENGQWTVLTGSQVRTAVMPSASSSATQRRAELLHSGALTRASGFLLLNEDIVFASASGAAHFVLGSKPTGDVWRPLPPEAAFETPRR